MRRIVIATMSTITTLVLLFSYHTSTTSTAVAQGSVVQAPVLSSPSASWPSDQGGSKTSTPSPTSAARTAASASYTGDVADTQWGPIQVQIAE